MLVREDWFPGGFLQFSLTQIIFQSCMPAKSLQLCPTLCDPVNDSPPGSSVHGDSPGKNTGVGCQALLQGIFPTQGFSQPVSLVSPALTGRFYITNATWEARFLLSWSK